MKKARALSTIFISLALTAPALAELPAPGCYAGAYGAADLAAQPTQGASELRLWLFDETPGSPAAIIAARMADHARGASDGVAGQELLQYTYCDADDGACFVECDGGSFDAQAQADGGVILRTGHLTVGDNDGCGGWSNLTRDGVEIDFRLAAAPAEVCADLSRTYPQPEPGCYGIEYSDMVRGQGVLALRLVLGASEPGQAFPLMQGWLAVTLPDGGRAADAGMGGARVQAPVWCSARDGQCHTGADEGSFALLPVMDGVEIATTLYRLYAPEDDGNSMDLAVFGQPQTRHALRRLPLEACRGLE